MQRHTCSKLTFYRVHRWPAVPHQRCPSAAPPLSAAASRRKQSCSGSSPGFEDQTTSPLFQLLFPSLKGWEAEGWCARC